MGRGRRRPKPLVSVAEARVALDRFAAQDRANRTANHGALPAPRYWGIVIGGPKAGQHIEAEMPEAHIPSMKGGAVEIAVYRWHDGLSINDFAPGCGLWVFKGLNPITELLRVYVMTRGGVA